MKKLTEEQAQGFDPEAPPVYVHNWPRQKSRCLNCGEPTTLDAWDHASAFGWTCPTQGVYRDGKLVTGVREQA